MVNNLVFPNKKIMSRLSRRKVTMWVLVTRMDSRLSFRLLFLYWKYMISTVSIVQIESGGVIYSRPWVVVVAYFAIAEEA